jgi:sugar lactone lactonase YvrE
MVQGQSEQERGVPLRRLVLLGLAAGLLLAAAAAPLGAAKGPDRFPETIPLPNGFQPEGIATSPGGAFFVGSIPTGAVYRGSLRTGRGDVLVQPQDGRQAIGVDYHRGLLFVAGGPTGDGYVYDARSGENVAAFDFTGEASFVNDVVATRRAAWFTDSQRPFLYRVERGPGGSIGGSAEAVELTGDFQMAAGFNVNGIDATPNGRTLIIVQSNTGKLFTVDTSGVTSEIDLGGGSVPNGDGILLRGRTLYVVQNRLNQIAVIRLSRDLESGEIVDTLTDPDFDVPTTIDSFGRRLYAVNARFGTTPTPDTTYSVVQVSTKQ